MALFGAWKVKTKPRAIPARVNAAAAASAFNSRGVVAAPSVVLAREAEPGGISCVVRAHRADDGMWIAEPSWSCMAGGSLPLDAALPHRDSKRFLHESEAVGAALSRCLRMVRDQKHRESASLEWLAKVEALSDWCAGAARSSRVRDKSLPLHGATAMELFAGGHGGFSVGFAEAGADIVLGCEIDEDAAKVYKANVRPRRMHGDICTLDLSKTKVDIVAMGLICQAFSKAGKGRGFADPVLSKVYAHAMRVLEEVDAKAVIIECAREFMTLDGGKHAQELITRMLACGYRAQHRALNAAAFGVPQDRERSILVFTRVGLHADPVMGYLFPEESEPSSCVEDILEKGVAATIPDSDIAFHKPEPCARVAAMARVGHIDGKKHQGYRVYSPKGLGATMTASGGGKAQFTEGYRVKGGARALTPREAARMQGMPEWFAPHPNRRCAMRQAGNAIAAPLARELGRALAKTICGRPPEE